MNPVIFCVKNEVSIQDGIFRYLLQFVQPEKRERILRQRIKQNADHMLIGDIVAKVAIKRVFGIEIARQRIGYGEFGKPYLLDHPYVHFNISHSGKYVVCAVCDVPVGIDVQKITAYHPKVAQRICSDEELEIVKGSDDVQSELIRIWTRKEAYLKRKGDGICGMGTLNMSSDSVYSYRFGDCWISLSRV